MGWASKSKQNQMLFFCPGFPDGSVVKNLPAMQEMKRHRFSPWVRKISWKRKWQPTSVFLTGKSQDGGAWQATVYGVAKSRIRLSDFTFFFFSFFLVKISLDIWLVCELTVSFLGRSISWSL